MKENTNQGTKKYKNICKTNLEEFMRRKIGEKTQKEMPQNICIGWLGDKS